MKSKLENFVLDTERAKGYGITIIHDKFGGSPSAHTAAPGNTGADIVFYFTYSMDVLGTLQNLRVKTSIAFSFDNTAEIEVATSTGFFGKEGDYYERVLAGVAAGIAVAKPIQANIQRNAPSTGPFNGDVLWPENNDYAVEDEAFYNVVRSTTNTINSHLRTYSRSAAFLLDPKQRASVIAYHGISDASVIAVRDAMDNYYKEVSRAKVSEIRYPNDRTSNYTLFPFSCGDITNACMDFAKLYLVKSLEDSRYGPYLGDFALHVHGGSQLMRPLNELYKIKNNDNKLKFEYDYNLTFLNSTQGSIDFPLFDLAGAGISGSESVLRVNNKSVPACKYEAAVGSIGATAGIGAAFSIRSPISYTASVNPDPTNQSLNTDGFAGEFIPPSELHKTSYLTYAGGISGGAEVIAAEANYAIGKFIYIPTAYVVGPMDPWPTHKRTMLFGASGPNLTVGPSLAVKLAGVDLDVAVGISRPIVTQYSGCRKAVADYLSLYSQLELEPVYGPYIITFPNDLHLAGTLTNQDNEVNDFINLLTMLASQAPSQTRIKIQPYLTTAAIAEKDRDILEASVLQRRKFIEREVAKRIGSSYPARKVDLKFDLPDVETIQPPAPRGSMYSHPKHKPAEGVYLFITVTQ